jgi:hypothetical protein
MRGGSIAYQILVRSALLNEAEDRDRRAAEDQWPDTFDEDLQYICHGLSTVQAVI